MAPAEHRERVEGYEQFFGLNETPFSLAPNPRFLFASDSHAAALAQVAYALERREPLVVITGEIGTGKTLLCRTVPQRLERKTFVSVINDPLLERDDLLKQLLQDFGVISKDRTRLTKASRHELIQTLQAFLISLVPIQAHAVVIIDEAQHLQPDVLEQIRLLSNIDDERGTLLQIVLVGQTDLEPLLSRPELRQFQQRVSRRFQLKPLNANEVQQYIEHRLALARSSKAPSEATAAREPESGTARWDSKPGVEFTPDAIQAVSKLSGGLPRVINLVCDRSLETAYVFRLRTIDSPLINTAARALGIAEDSVPTGLPERAIATAPDKEAELDKALGNVAAPYRHAELDKAFGTAAAPDTQAELDKAFGTIAAPDKQADLDKAFGTFTAFEPAAPDQSLLRAEEAVPSAPRTFAERATATSPRTYLVLATALATAVVVIWLGVRAANPPTTLTPPEARPAEATPAEATAPAPPAVAAPTAQPDPVPDGAPGGAPRSVPERDAATGPSTPTVVGATAATPAPGATAAAATVERFEIVIASFRAEAGATSVAAEVAALGLPVRRRVLDGWQQVLSGPFASRAQAAEAQQRLERSGLTGTQIVQTAR